jgi:hypothetical protein
VADELREVVALTLKRRPWMIAEEWSFWRASGRYSAARGTFTDCLMVALPHYVTGGAVLFKMIGPMEDIVTPDEIDRATELRLVPASPNEENDRG